MSRGRFFLPATAQCAFIRSITTIDGPFLAQTARSIETPFSMNADMLENMHHAPHGRIASGILGLDDILGGGLTPHRMYLVEGAPGG
jgi:predicted ATP-dependent serine protease